MNKKYVRIILLVVFLFCMAIPVHAKEVLSENVFILAKTKGCDTFIDLVKTYWPYVTILAPIGLIILITMDFIKAVASGDADAISKSSKDAMHRTFAALLLLLLPTIIRIIYEMFGLPICF